MDETTERLTDQLVAALRALPRAVVDEVRRPGGDERAKNDVDAEIRLALPTGAFTLLVETKRDVFPRDAREALWRLRRLRNLFSHQPDACPATVPLLAARSISAGAKQILHDEDIGYFDSGGSLFIPGPGSYVYIERQPPKALAKTSRAIFKGKRAQVLHALIQQRERWLGVNDLAHLAEVSPTTASDTLIFLERSEWVDARGQGPAKERRLSNPKILLDAWVRYIEGVRPPPTRRYHVPGYKPEALMEKLDRVCARDQTPYAVTQEAAAQLYTPYLTSISRVASYLPAGPDAERVASTLEARPVTDGANFIVLEAQLPGETIFKERIGAIWAANAVQVYLDLLRAGGRGRDMADHLRSERIGF